MCDPRAHNFRNPTFIQSQNKAKGVGIIAWKRMHYQMRPSRKKYDHYGIQCRKGKNCNLVASHGHCSRGAVIVRDNAFVEFVPGKIPIPCGDINPTIAMKKYGKHAPEIVKERNSIIEDSKIKSTLNNSVLHSTTFN